MFWNSRKSGDRLWLALIAVLSIVYIGYAFRAGFYTDDFVLQRHYSGEYAAWWDYHQHFGRIFTRYVYWTYLPGIFGNRTELYFLFNFSFVLLGAWAFGMLVAALAESDRLALPATAFYLLAPTTFHGFTWISTFQHIGAYPFFFLFVWKMVELSRQWHRRTAVVAMLFLGLALISNQFAIVAPAAAFVLTLPWLRKNRRYLALILALGVLSLAMVLYIKSNHAQAAYGQEISWAVAQANLFWYMGRLGFGSSAPKYLAISFVALFVLARAPRSTLLVGVAVIVALPFVFLLLRRNTYFFHLAYVFLMAALVFAACRFEQRSARGMVIAAVMVLVGYSSFHLHRDTYLNPLGGDLKREVSAIREALPGRGNTICIVHGPGRAISNHLYHIMTDGLRAYAIMDPENIYVGSWEPACASASYTLVVHKEEDGTLHHELIDVRSGATFSTQVSAP